MSFGAGGQIGEAWYNLTVKDEGVMAGLHAAEAQFAKSGQVAENAFDAAGDAIAHADDQIAQVATSAGKLGGVFSKFGDVGRKAIGGIGEGIAQSFGGVLMNAPMMAMEKIGNAVNLARDKAEAASKANVIFGDSYGIVEKASKDATSTVNMSSGAYLAAAGDLGNLTTNLGYTGDEAASMSVDMIQLAADMGSFSNASPEEVVQAMGAAFRGETEPIRRFGVMLDEAAIQAKALEMGLVAEGGQLDKNAKAQATYALILEQTSNAQGDLARTADSLANQQKRAAAEQEEAWTKIGDKLVPLIQKLLPMLQGAIMLVVGSLGAMIDFITSIIDSLQPLIQGFMGVTKAAGDVATKAFGPLIVAGQKVVDLALGPLKPLIIGIAGTITALLIPALLTAGRTMLTNFVTSTLAAANALMVKLFPSLVTVAGAEGAGGLTEALKALISPMGLVAVSAGLLVVAAVKLGEAWDAARVAAEKYIDAAPELEDGVLTGAEAVEVERDAVLELADAVDDAKQRIATADAGLSNAFGIAKPIQNLALELDKLLGTEAINVEINDRLAESQKLLTTARDEDTASALSARDAALEGMGPRQAMTEAMRDEEGALRDLTTQHVTSRVAAMESAQAGIESLANYMEGQRVLLQTAYEIGTGIPSSIGQGMVDESREILSASENLRNVLENGLTPAQQLAEVMGGKWGKLFAQGIRSEIPGAREAAFRMGTEGLQALSTATIGTKEAKRIAEIAAGLYEDGWSDSEVAVGLAAQGVGEEALRKIGRVAGWSPAAIQDAVDYINGLESKEGAAGNAGEDLGESALDGAANLPWSRGGSAAAGDWIGAFGRTIEGREQGIMNKLRRLSQAFIGQSPPPRGPLKDIDKGGYNVGKAWADAFEEGIGMGVGRLMPFGNISTGYNGEIRAVVRHEIDLRNAPPGITNETVADMVAKGTDATGLHFALRHASTLRYREGGA